MAKRKLNQQQQRRLQQKRVQALPEDKDDTETQTGLVITNFGKRLLVESHTGELFNCAVRQHLDKLVAGDQVLWQPDIEPQTGVVVSAVARTQELSRPGFRGQKRMVAANIDLLGIVAPVEPGIHPDMIDRYLVAAHQLNLPCILIINKIDLIASEAHWEAIETLLTPYMELGIPILPLSTETHQGVEELRLTLNDQNAVFVGPSGAGKSSLIQALIPDIDIKINELSESTGLGKHTTTNSILYHLPEHKGHYGNIIDSPGVRQFSPEPCELHALEQAYPDFAPFLGQCKFHNCTHLNEPGCAIQAAVEAGDIHYTRFQSFQRLRAEFKEQLS